MSTGGTERSDAIDVVRRAVAGDAAALTILLTEAHGDLCRYVARRMPRDLATQLDAEDVVQMTCVEVFRHIGTFAADGPDAFGRWIRTIALRRLRNAIRERRTLKRGAERPLAAIEPGFGESAAALLEWMAVSERTPSRSVSGREAIERMQAALHTLPDDMRRAITLVYLEGRSAAEAAASLGCNEKAIYNHCHRGKEWLEELLGNRSQYFSSSG
ncbi:MAG: ECF RNA polymerase sigma-E factor [Phycisphaerae bacterium]|nr:ECF RNA polymerase sigma-E factor [Phycisphaerae bacterium]